MRILLSMLLCACLPTLVAAQDKKDKKPGDEMIEKYLAAETDKLSAKFLDGAKTIDEWKQKRPRLYQEYMDMLGLWPMPEKTPLKTTQTGQVEAHGVVVEMIHFQSKPGLYVTANLYRPKGDGKQYPAILYVCGHSSKGRDGNKTAFQDHGFWFANHGYVCLILDTLQLGEIPGVHHGTYGRPWGHLTSWGVKDGEKMKNHNRFWWHSIGYSPAAVECWNGIRAIDYLCTRDDVDRDKIGVTGISGGGAATFWIAAADDRVKVAVPVSGMADLEFYVKNKGVNGHCDCMFLYNIYQWDWTTIAALVAPRPLLFANSDQDPIFPMDANRRIYKKLEKIYGMYGADKALQEKVSVGGHDYRPDLRKAIFHFFNVHLKRMPTAVVEDSAKYTPLEGKKLRVFPEDKDLPKDAINHRIDELFIPPARVTLPEKEGYEKWKNRMIVKLGGSAFRGSPGIQDFSGYQSAQTSASGKNTDRIAFLIAEEDDRANVDKLVKGYVGESEYHCFRSLFFALPKGVGSVSLDWTRNSPPNTFIRSSVLIGQTVDARRVGNFIATLRFEDKTKRWTVIGKGQMGIIAAYAALFEPSIKEVVVIDPPKSHKEGPYFLNVMRVLDIPEALGLLAPTPLTIIGGKDAAFDRTAEIYKLAGAADKLKRK